MKSTHHRTSALVVSTVLLPAAAPCAQACAVCFGARGGAISNAANMMLLVMLGFVFFILLSIGGFIFLLARRGHASRAELEKAAGFADHHPIH